jgi:hypothetical protein
MKKYTLFLVGAILSSSYSSCYAESEQEWGSWGEASNNSAMELDDDSKKNYDSSLYYGSGIAGSDENLLHELDQSTLLDYSVQIEEQVSLPGGFPILDDNQEHATGMGDVDVIPVD